MKTYLYRFSKKINSTYRPSDSKALKDGDSVYIDIQYVYLKDGTSIYDPVFLMQVDNNTIPNFNYIQLPKEEITDGDQDFYYSVDDITPVANNLFEIKATLDPLATDYDNISATGTGFLRYGNTDSGYYKAVNDPRISPTAAYVGKQSGTILTNFVSGGIQTVLSYVSGDPNTDSFIATRAFNDTNMELVAKMLSNSDFLDNIDKKLTAAKECFISCKYFPVALEFSMSKSCNFAGYTGSGAIGYVPRRIQKIRKTISMYPVFGLEANKAIPVTTGRGATVSVMDCLTPYTELEIYLTGYGIAQLDPADFIDISGNYYNIRDLVIDLIIDQYTGETTYILRVVTPGVVTSYTNSKIIGRYVTNIAIDIPLGINSGYTGNALANMVINGISAAVSIGGAVATGGATTGLAVASTAQAAGSVVNTLVGTQRNIGSIGTNSGISSIYGVDSGLTAVVYSKLHGATTSISNVENVGELTLQYVEINKAKFGGLLQFDNFDYKSKLPNRFKQQVINYATTGFYLEHGVV